MTPSWGKKQTNKQTLLILPIFSLNFFHKINLKMFFLKIIFYNTLTFRREFDVHFAVLEG